MYFDIFDMNKDGTIQREEFASVIHHFLSDMDDSNFDQFFNALNNKTNDQVGLNREEFTKFYKTLVSATSNA